MEVQNLPHVPPCTISIKIETLLGMQYLLVPDHSRIHKVLIKDIVRLEGIKNYTLLHLNDGKIMISSRTLKVYSGILKEADFFRIHRAHLINMQFLRNYDETQMLYAVMQNRDIISISRRKRKDFQERMVIKK